MNFLICSVNSVELSLCFTQIEVSIVLTASESEHISIRYHSSIQLFSSFSVFGGMPVNGVAKLHIIKLPIHIVNEQMLLKLFAREYLNSMEIAKRPCYLLIIYSLLITKKNNRKVYSWTEILLVEQISYLCQSLDVIFHLVLRS